MEKIRSKSNKKRKKLWKVFCRTGNEQTGTEYRRTGNQVRIFFLKAAKQYEKNIVNNKENPKKLCSYVRKKSKVRVGVLDLQKNDGSQTENNEEKAKTLVDYFTSVLFHRNK